MSGLHQRAELERRMQEAEQFVRARWGEIPADAVVLGSGLGSLADELEDARVLPVSEIPGHPVPTVPGHAGRWVLGRLRGAPVLALSGRVHMYEGHNFEQVTFATVLLRRLGVRRLVITNASGATTTRLHPGDLMLVTGALNLFWGQPVWVPGAVRGEPLDPELMRIAEQVAAERGIALRKGVQSSSLGPSYETAAEIRMVAGLGGHAVGMSTVPEILAAGQLGLRVLCIACITNLGTGLSDNPLSHDEVTETARRVAANFRGLIEGILATFAREDP